MTNTAAPSPTADLLAAYVHLDDASLQLGSSPGYAAIESHASSILRHMALGTIAAATRRANMLADELEDAAEQVEFFRAEDRDQFTALIRDARGLI